MYFQIGETIHSGPTHLVQKDIKHEQVEHKRDCIFPSDSQESACALPESSCPADIPSKHCSSLQSLPATNCRKSSKRSRKPLSSLRTASLRSPGNRILQSKCKVEPNAPLLTVQVPEAVVPKPTVIIHDALAISQVSVSEAAVPDSKVSEAALPEVPLVEPALPHVPVAKAVASKTTFNAILVTNLHGEEIKVPEPVFIKQEPCDIVDPLSEEQSFDATSSPLTDPVQVKVEKRDMVRLIQEVDSRIDSLCNKRSGRTAKRFGSSEVEGIEIKTEPMPRGKRCTRTRRSSCRSDKSESEASDSRSVTEDPLSLDMVDKTAKRGKPKNGEPLLDEAAAHANVKFNGDVSVDLVNGAHKVKGRRVSRANSDESDLSSCSKSNGNVDHNNEKIDFNLLLEISDADREKFESKKAKIRRKTADWLLISETERYYNEKEEIMRNKNRPESESESDDSESDCSDEDANPPRVGGNGKRKQSGCVGDDDSKVGAKRVKEELDSINVRGRPVGGRTRKPRYDLTMLNDDEDDDDENFFGFPVSTTIPPSTEGCSLSSTSVNQLRSRGKGVGKVSVESSSSSSCGKAGRKRLSDAERFLRDNREYYHFQETKERLRRSTSSSSGDKEKVGNGDDVSCHTERNCEKKDEAKIKEIPSVSRKRPSIDGVRRVTRRTGGSIDLDVELEKEGRKCKNEVKGDRKIVVKEERDIKSEMKISGRRDGLRHDRKIEVKSEKIDDVKKDNTKSDKKDERRHDKKDDGKHDKKDDGKHDKKDDGKHDKKDDGKHDKKDEGKHDKKDEGKIEKKDEGKNENKDEGKNEKKDEGKAEKKDEGKNEKKDEGKLEKKDEGKNEKKDEGKLEKKDEGKLEKKDEGKNEKTDDGKIEKKDEKKSEKKEDGKMEKKDDGKSEKKENVKNNKMVEVKDIEKVKEVKMEEERKTKEGTIEKGVKDNKDKVVSEEKKNKDIDRRKDLKDEKKNGLKDKELEEILDHKLGTKDSVQDVIKSKKGEGNCSIKSEENKDNTVVDESKGDSSLRSSLHINIKDEDDIEKRENLSYVDDLTKAGYSSDLEELYFSFEGVPENESWYQTYQRFIDGIAVNEFVYDEDPLRFVLPYEMPKEYIRDFISLKKGLLSKKKNDLADLVRKSPRCHASTLALFSDILPTRRSKGSRAPKIPPKVEEVSSDGTSTPGADSIRMQPQDSFESMEELNILALHFDHVIKSELQESVEAPLSIPLFDDIKDVEESDLRKTPPKKRGKKKRLLANSKSTKSVETIVKELKLLESPLAHEVDPNFIAGLSDEGRDFSPDNIMASAAAEVIEDSNQCLCNDRASCEDFSSADENTEASSECVSLCDSETIDSSTASEPKPVRSNKKRRKNLTGWPKAQKKKKATASHTSDDDSAIGCEEIEPKRRGCRRKQNFCFFEPTTAQKLAALAANDRRASPRKKSSVLYMDTWPVRFRTQK